jgi:carbonic anhydrase
MSIDKLKKGNVKFTKTFVENKQLYLDLVENGQHPKVMWVGCSDSRVVPEFIVNANAGDLFVIRNIANIIPPFDAHDSNSSSVLEYAVEHLHVEHIVICGHTGCGGINAMLKGIPQDSVINDWMQHAGKAKENAEKQCCGDLEINTIKANVLLQADHLLSFGYVKKRVKENRLKIHKWLYEMSNGSILFFNETDEKWRAL